jgi:hypothetical protein
VALLVATNPLTNAFALRSLRCLGSDGGLGVCLGVG